MTSDKDFTTADKLFTEEPQWQQLPDWHSPTNNPKHRLLVDAVPEARKYRRDVCNQHCKTHLYFKDGTPYEQLTGEYHDCPISRIVKMFEAKWNMIRIPIVTEALETLRLVHLTNVNIALERFDEVIKNQETYNKKWAAAFDYWKQTGIVPKTVDVDSGKYLDAQS